MGYSPLGHKEPDMTERLHFVSLGETNAAADLTRGSAEVVT